MPVDYHRSVGLYFWQLGFDVVRRLLINGVKIIALTYAEFVKVGRRV